RPPARDAPRFVAARHAARAHGAVGAARLLALRYRAHRDGRDGRTCRAAAGRQQAPGETAGVAGAVPRYFLRAVPGPAAPVFGFGWRGRVLPKLPLKSLPLKLRLSPFP